MTIQIWDMSKKYDYQKNLNKNFSKIKLLKKDYNTKTFDEAVEFIQADKDNKIIMISDFATYPATYCAKSIKVVTAEISDAHSSKMTHLHNNANILSLSTELSSEDMIIDLINYYIGSYFEAGRHMVRVNMLDKLLSEEK